MGVDPALSEPAPTGFSEWELGHISLPWNSPLYSFLAGGPCFFPLALCLDVCGRRAWKRGLQKNAWFSGNVPYRNVLCISPLV